MTLQRASIAVFLFLFAAMAMAQPIVQSRGADPQLDYASLTRFGAWDDRNYQLTQADIALLSADEDQLDTSIPAFYRVELRKTIPVLRTSGPAQYPHSAKPQFFNKYGGYLIDGVYYRSAHRVEGAFQVDMAKPWVETERPAPKANKALNGDARVTMPNGAAETAIAFHPTNTDLVIAGSNGPSGGQKMHWSSDGGETWSQVTLPLGGECCDPTVAWSSDGTLAYAATLSGAINANWFYRSSNNGQSWDDLASLPGNDPRREIGGSGSDKEFIHVDTYPTSPHLDHIYLTWHQGNVLRFSKSTDFGDTWSTPLAFGSDPVGIGSDITSDKNGNIFYTYLSFATQQVLAKVSTDGGDSFAPAVVVDTTNGSFTYPIPVQNQRGVPMIASMDADLSDGPFANSVYIAWPDASAPESTTPANNHSQIKVAYSRDQGATWTTTIPHETADLDTVDRYQSWIRVAPNGNVFIVFYDTRNSGVARDGLDLYFNVSTDGAQTWGIPQRLSTAVSPEVTNSGFDFGDYNGMDIVMDDLIAIFTDNRDESGGTANSRDAYVAGTNLFSATIFNTDFETGDCRAWAQSSPPC